jgi:hypothetical protein
VRISLHKIGFPTILYKRMASDVSVKCQRLEIRGQKSDFCLLFSVVCLRFFILQEVNYVQRKS